MRIWFGLILVSLALAPAVRAQQSMNLDVLERDTQIFEGIIEQVLRQNFTNPFAVTAQPMAAYLQGYGIVVSFHLNINRARIRTPFGQVQSPPAAKDRSRQEQIRLVRDEMIEVLADYGTTFKQISGHDRISIHARIEDKNELDPLKNRINLVITASKDNVELYAMRKITFDSFKGRVHVLEY